MTSPIPSLNRPYDSVLTEIADYLSTKNDFGLEAFETARLCLMDSLGCGLLALAYPACTKMLGPVVPGAALANGSRVPGTAWKLEPVKAAFNIGCMIRWLDYNDTWLAAEWGHPSDNFGAILALTDYLDRNPNNSWQPDRQWTVRDILHRAIQAYEIQGVLALENGFNRVGLDHVMLVRIASTAVACSILGGTKQQIADAISLAWIDGGALRTYRHVPNTGSRKSWAAGDATQRAVQLALWTMAGEMGYASALTAPRWGFNDVVLNGKQVVIGRKLGSYVMENILFKVSFPAEFHAQTAAEAAMQLHPSVIDKLDAIQKITIHTQESAVRIIDKQGALVNPADRDHCLQYIVAVAMLHGGLNSEHYEDAAAADPRIDQLRQKMVVIEDPRYSKDYLDSDLRSIANRIQVFFADGTTSTAIEIEFPLGHRRRRAEAIFPLKTKFRHNAGTRFSSSWVDAVMKMFDARETLWEMRVSHFMDQFAEAM
ncbi:MAG TPA: bifunctional 2-methylcitrate dehydratase/aconitate hydratase [Pirellula sp.]|nr:bifunctional 2-methylcitrate dehydratase/aconitate hydratase [Pirellula sp.]